MISIGLRFLSGRHHSGRDHHVNEDTLEWPPSPFRLLRALVAASYKLGPEPGALRGLLEKLSGLPLYRLPQASCVHTRHDMPLGGFRGLTGPGTTCRVFDAFVAVGRGAGDTENELIVAWPEATMESDEKQLLGALLSCIGYLGRAESRVEARVLEESPGAFNARPVTPGEEVASRILLPALLPPREYQAWREGFLAGQTGKKKKIPPQSFWDVLHHETGQLQEEGWSSPPGVRWVEYGLQEGPFRVRYRRRPAQERERIPQVARYALQSAVPPPIWSTLPLGERMRQALMAHSRAPGGHALPVFSGKDAEGRPLTGHRHAFYLPFDEDGDGYLDHILVWAREGFSPEAQRALRQVRRLWGAEGHDIHLALVGLGQPEEYGCLRSEAAPGRSLQLGRARVWESFSPFLLSRHPKPRRKKDSPEEQLCKGLSWLGLPAPARIEQIEERPWWRFRRVRYQGGGALAGSQGYGFRLTFAEPVQGPIAVGYGSHQGLGQFIAVE